MINLKLKLNTLFCILLLGILITSCQDDQVYKAQIEEEIENRIKYLQYNDESPFQQFDIAFKRPSYFPIDQRYRVTARIERLQGRSYRTIGTSDGKSKRYLEYAWLHFFLNDTEQKLLVLKPIRMGPASTLFLAFADDTSGESTYGAGRYIDITIGKSDKVTLDFNLAYNPYCAYVADYSCPFPPVENVLTTAVRAGEKDFEK